ncbi:MAG: hypothetical protein JNK02_08675 [Planctomycetes bacterium]|nr:hypothetical protein [Planctomycetota bacterium]
MRVLVTAAALLLAQAAALDAQRSAPPLATPAPADERGAPLEGLERISCQRCHADVVREWAGTLHGKAWVDAPYREELADARRPESCHNCHIPEPLHLQLGADGSIPQRPKPRDATLRDVPLEDVDAHFGVSCESCHRGPDGTILGPYGAPTDAHVSVKHASFLPESNSALCIACHATTVGPVIGIAKDFVDTEQHAQGRSCVGCHMAPVERPAASEPGKPALPPRAGRSHELQTPRDPGFLARAFELRLERRDGALVLVVVNACGHRVPGRVGRVLTLEAELVDGSGAVVASATHTIETKRSLPADGQLELVLRGSGASVRVRGVHEAPALPDAVVFLERVLALP